MSVQMSASGRGFWKPWLIRIAFAAVVAGVFSPLFSAEFLQWDDGKNLFENPLMLPPSWSNCAYYWSHASLSLYIPATYTVWSGLAAISQTPGDGPNHRTLNPAIFHIANVVAHALAVIVVFNILRMFTRDLPAAMGALIFAIHPMQVEAVGWVCGMKDVLAGLFGLIAVWLYLGHVASRSGRFSWRYLAASVAFLAGTLSKPSALIVPVVCAVIAVGLLHMPWRRVMLDMTPWLCVSGAIAVIAALVQPTHYVSQSSPLWTRPLIATDALAFYLRKLVWPVGLCLDYGRSPPNVLNSGNGQAFWTWIIPLSVGILLWWKRKEWPRVGIAALVSLAALLPVLGLARFNFQNVSTVADHYFYFAMLGPAIALASFLPVRGRSFAVAALAVSVMTVLAVMCHAQTFMWMSEPVAFAHVLDVNPRSEVGHSHLWQLAMNRGNFAGAEVEAKAIISLYPADSRGYMDLGDTLSETDRWREAADAYQRAIHLEPENAVPYNNLAALYAAHGDSQRAIVLYRKALELAPNFIEAKAALAMAMKAAGTGGGK
jgi:protein O-mannosyl-transferase